MERRSNHRSYRTNTLNKMRAKECLSSNFRVKFLLQSMAKELVTFKLNSYKVSNPGITTEEPTKPSNVKLQRSGAKHLRSSLTFVNKTSQDVHLTNRILRAQNWFTVTNF